jgi:hypothetical protein
VKLAGGVPFVSDADLEKALDKSNVDQETANAALDDYREARISGLISAVALLAFAALIGLFLAQRIPRKPVT